MVVFVFVFFLPRGTSHTHREFLDICVAFCAFFLQGTLFTYLDQGGGW